MSGDKASPCFRTALTGNVGHKCLPLLALPWSHLSIFFIEVTRFVAGYLLFWDVTLQRRVFGLRRFEAA